MSIFQHTGTVYRVAIVTLHANGETTPSYLGPYDSLTEAQFVARQWSERDPVIHSATAWERVQ